MVGISIRIEERQFEELQARAQRLGMSVEDLAHAGVLDLLRGGDDAFEQAATRVLAKNSELYRRLA